LWTGIATAALIHLRRTRPELKRPIEFPLILPYSFTAGCMLLTAFAIYADPKGAAIGSSLMFVGIPVYFFYQWITKGGNNNTTSSGKFVMTCTCLGITRYVRDIFNAMIMKSPTVCLPLIPRRHTCEYI